MRVWFRFYFSGIEKNCRVAEDRMRLSPHTPGGWMGIFLKPDNNLKLNGLRQPQVLCRKLTEGEPGLCVRGRLCLRAKKNGVDKSFRNGGNGCKTRQTDQSSDTEACHCSGGGSCRKARAKSFFGHVRNGVLAFLLALGDFLDIVNGSNRAADHSSHDAQRHRRLGYGCQLSWIK